ncbi:hypothetical protein BFL43_02960 [Williamsia sp. 1135]|nr:hypothetical protein BFL43_02960 [Williamsia sp. 1135]
MYLAELSVDNALQIERTIESDIAEGLLDEHRWPRVIVGDAGTGKSTLLWSLATELFRRGRATPILLSATWLLRTDVTGPVDYLVQGLNELSERSDVPVILMLDTVDLLLHDLQAHQILLRALKMVERSGIAVICATRPHEAGLLSIDNLRDHQLSSYDDDELDLAATALANRYCQGAPPGEVVASIGRATARGLPAADVCRSPLLLRVLFELSAPAVPALDDLDMTQLFRSYWQRRIVRDARTDIETHYRPAAQNNYSEVARASALGLLATGLPELPPVVFPNAVAAVGGLSAADIDEGIDALCARGVLSTTGDRRSFFHQTMFEFAAAEAILARRPAQSLATLTQRTSERDGDLFVGCVLEQALILGGDDPALAADLVASTTQLTRSPSEAIQGIALVAWAHHSSCLDQPRISLRAVGASAVIRAAHHIPSIAAKPIGESISQLLVIWEVRTDIVVKAAVLTAMTRLAYRDPTTVAHALEHLDLVAAVTSPAVTPDFENALLRLLDSVAATAPVLVRRVLVAVLTHATTRAHIALDYFTRLWPAIGSADLFAEVVRVVEDLNVGNHTTAFALGRLLYQHRILPGAPHTADQWREITAHLASQPDEMFVFMDEAELIAVGQMLVAATVPDVINEHLQMLLDTTSDTARSIVIHHVLPALAAASGAPRECVRTQTATIANTLDGGTGTMSPSREQRLVVELLGEHEVPLDFIADVMPPALTAADWISNDLLLPLAPRAADAGIASAHRALTQLAAAPDPNAAIDPLLRRAIHRTPTDEQVFDCLLQISLAAGRTQDATALVSGSERRYGRVDKHAPAIVSHCRERLASPAAEDRESGALLLARLMGSSTATIEWSEVRGALHVATGTRAHRDLIGCLWLQTSPEDVSDLIDYLSSLIDVDPGRTPPIRRRRGVDVASAAAAVEASLRILALRADPTTTDWDMVRTLGCYNLEDADKVVSGTKFAVVMDHIVRVHETSSAAASSMLLDYLAAVSRSDFFGIDVTLWRRHCAQAVRVITRAHPTRIGPALIELCGVLDTDVGTVILDELAAESYTVLREDIVRLSRTAATDDMRTHVLDTIRSHDRVQGSLAFPEILAALDKSPRVYTLVELEEDLRERRNELKAATDHAATTLPKATGMSVTALCTQLSVSTSTFKRLRAVESWGVPSPNLCRLIDDYGATLGHDFGLSAQLAEFERAEDRLKDRNSHVRRQQ